MARYALQRLGQAVFILLGITLVTYLLLFLLPADPARFLAGQRRAHGIAALPIDEGAVAQIGKLPDHHRDPFDRILVCQAIVGGMSIVTPDDLIARYPVSLLW